ncbi:type II toxin-antitoxin system RelE/ParE family toxin [Acrocarpospora sp. B8E8]|uniref:type II toxin-antitoxin system RelE/ParE family toxin n=1 Tax=Acrocarpospora sp. B8E8 TaxID=3153572 RepID=UPI00325EECE8
MSQSGELTSRCGRAQATRTWRGRDPAAVLFDPTREAIVLVAGDKAGEWNRWYRTAIPLAEERYAAYREDDERVREMVRHQDQDP